jgi:hypothetical protein
VCVWYINTPESIRRRVVQDLSQPTVSRVPTVTLECEPDALNGRSKENRESMTLKRNR